MKALFSLLFLLATVSMADSAFAATPPDLLPAVENIYAANFATAKSTISAYIAVHPDKAYGYLLRGIANEWDQLVNNKGSSLDASIMADYEKARQLAEAKLENDSGNLEKKVDLSNALIYVAKKQIDRGHKVQAGSTLKKASALVQEVIEKNPGHTEAYFAIGLFNYFADNVPDGFKWLAAILGFRGDRHKGLSYIQKAASAPSLTQGDAKFMLTYIYSQKESKYDQALLYAQQLNSRYPANPIFLFDTAEMQFRTKKIADSRANFVKFFAHCETHKGSCAQKYQYLANYFMTWSFVDEKNYKEAKKYLENAIQLDTKKYKDRSSDLKKWSELLDVGGS